MTSPIFTLDPTLHDEMLDQLISPDCSLRDIAERFNTTVEALSAWLATDGRSLLDSSLHAAAMRTRLAATHALPAAVTALVDTLQDYADERSRISSSPRDDRDSPQLREHRRSNLRRAAHLLHRLSHYTPRSTEPTSTKVLPTTNRATDLTGPPRQLSASHPNLPNPDAPSHSCEPATTPPPTQSSGAGVPPAPTKPTDFTSSDHFPKPAHFFTLSPPSPLPHSPLPTPHSPFLPASGPSLATNPSCITVSAAGPRPP